MKDRPFWISVAICSGDLVAGDASKAGPAAQPATGCRSSDCETPGFAVTTRH